MTDGLLSFFSILNELLQYMSMLSCLGCAYHSSYRNSSFVKLSKIFLHMINGINKGTGILSNKDWYFFSVMGFSSVCIARITAKV